MDIVAKGKNKEAIREELLGYLRMLEEDGWLIFGWHHMNLEKTKWLKEPQKLADCEYYQKILKSWLKEGRTVESRKSSPGGLVKYKGMDSGFLTVESIYFNLWLAKGSKVCLLSYGEHEFPNNEGLEEELGEARFTIIFKDWLEVILVVLNKEG